MSLVSACIKASGIYTFYEKVYNFTEDANGCWNYNGYLDEDGYAYTSFTRKIGNIAVYRIWYELWKGVNTEPSKVIDHTCRNRKCVNPNHLELVTVATNTRRGKSAKLTTEVASEIRALAATRTMSQAAIARKFNVTPATVSYLLSGKTWRENTTTIRINKREPRC